MNQPRSFYLAGTMQGSREGVRVLDQGYRDILSNAIEEACPGATIHCPHRILHERFGARGGELIRAYQALADKEWLGPQELAAGAREVSDAFRELVYLAGWSDVVVAYLPDQEASMGTAIEMWQAHQNGRVVVTITSMRQNLAVLSTSTMIVPSIQEFGQSLKDGKVARLLPHLQAA